MLTTALIVGILVFLVYLVGGVFFRVPQKYLKPALLMFFRAP